MMPYPAIEWCILSSAGQTGSGKTYTMGSGFTPGGPGRGVIPEVMDELFARVAAGKEGVDLSVRVSFVEIHKVRGDWLRGVYQLGGLPMAFGSLQASDMVVWAVEL